MEYEKPKKSLEELQGDLIVKAVASGGKLFALYVGSILAEMAQVTNHMQTLKRQEGVKPDEEKAQLNDGDNKG